MTGEELRVRYFTAMRGADLDATLALFADDAGLTEPMRSYRCG